MSTISIEVSWNDPDCFVDWDVAASVTSDRPLSDEKPIWAWYDNLNPTASSIQFHHSGDVSGKSGSETITFDTFDLIGLIPQSVDVVINLFSSSCPTSGQALAGVDVNYKCDSNSFFSGTFVGINDGQELFQAGDRGLAHDQILFSSPQAQPPRILVLGFDCASVTTGGVSTCWQFTAARANGRLLMEHGPGRAPSRFVVPDDVDLETCTLVEDGEMYSPSEYLVMTRSVAHEAAMSNRVSGSWFIVGGRTPYDDDVIRRA